MEKDWGKVLEIIKGEMTPPHYRTWFSKSILISYQNNLLTIGVPSAFIKQQINIRYQSTLEETCKKVFGIEIQVELKVESSLASQPNNQFDEPEFELSYQEPKNESIGLNPRYTLDSFVVGFSNNLAYAAAQAVVQNPGVSYNPLFIYGGTGVGKTHLMHSIGNSLIKKNPGVKVIYCSSEKFMNDFIESIQTKRTNEFRRKYRECDLFLVDDIQFVSGRDSTQEEFFHTFNELQAKNSQVVLTSDRPPNEIQKLEPRLASRFQGGLMVDIQNPDFDTRVAILRAKCNERGWDVPEECLTAIAENMATNARELEGKLIQTVQSINLSGQPITLEAVRLKLGQVGLNTSLLKTDYRKVLTQLNQYFNIKMHDLLGPRRNKGFVLPRQLAMYILYENCDLPYERIGQILGGRDHTTIMHGVEKIKGGLDQNPEIQRLMSEIKLQLNP